MKTSPTRSAWARLVALAVAMLVHSTLHAQDPRLGAYKGTITIKQVATSIGSGALTTKSTSKVDAEAVVPDGMTKPVVHILGVPDAGRVGASARKYCYIDLNNTIAPFFFFGGDKGTATVVTGTGKVRGNSFTWDSSFSQTAGNFDEFTFQTTVTIKLTRVP